MKRPRGCRGRFCVLVFSATGVLVTDARSVSGALDGEGVEVVGQDRPAGPGPGAVVASEAAAAQTVAALEVADPALAAGAVAGQALLGPARRRVLSPGDEDVRVGEVVVGGIDREPPIERDLQR